jgi:hypothetical protein
MPQDVHRVSTRRFRGQNLTDAECILRGAREPVSPSVEPVVIAYFVSRARLSNSGSCAGKDDTIIYIYIYVSIYKYIMKALSPKGLACGLELWKCYSEIRARTFNDVRFRKRAVTSKKLQLQK